MATEELETVAREYELDEETMTLRQVWAFGEGQGLHAHTAGEALRLPNGNTLHNYGSFGRLREVTPDGTIVWGAAGGFESKTLEEVHEALDVRHPDGEIERVWSCREDFLDVVGWTESHHCQSNALEWYEDRGTYLFSLPSQDAVVEIDGVTGASLRWWGHVEGGWAFDPPESAFYWQHGAKFTEAGTLLVSAEIAEDVEETVVREYELDEGTQTLRQIWTFGEGEGVYAKAAGEAHRLPNRNTLHNYGTGGRIREVTTDGRIAWDLAWDPAHLNDLYGLIDP